MILATAPSTTYLVIGILGLTVVTVLTRSSFFMLPERWSLPPKVEHALRYAPACALVAIIVPSVLTRDHEVFVSWSNHQMWAVLAGTSVFAFRRNMVLMMLVTMAVFTALRLAG